jgi:GcrA cell cycle regulator
MTEPWTDDRAEQLRTMWADDGLSARDIAHELRTTRNAVLGKVHRLKLTPRTSITSSGGRPRKAGKPRPERKQRFFLPERPEPGPMPDLPPETAIRPMALVQLKVDSCRWPCTGEGLSVVFCGNTAVDGCPYCARHCRVAYRPR